MKPKNKGFTLAELLLATSILAISLTAILLVYINCVLLNDSNRNLTIALTHAQFALEEIKNTSFSNIDNYNGFTWLDNGSDPGFIYDTLNARSTGLTALNNEQIDFTVTNEGGDANFLNVTAAVSWEDRNGRDRSTSLQTLIYRQI